ncbi:unnamed protein product [Hydatigera taeniaeformis]|uniref:R3H domain-containing protein n=1 Tax=Hydatigena taeniaeformis TaxID=6205 RepID=A0A0R3WLK2_HYDTA|nr:unnamed protein product [Hydatigera taeniaeformis]
MSLRIQSLTHYSDFDGTSESETSELSIVLPFSSRFRSKKQSQPSEGRIRQKKGARAIRRYENGRHLSQPQSLLFLLSVILDLPFSDAYLSTLAMITEASGEDDMEDYWVDRVTGDTGFNIREIWDAFISLSETEQIELLGSLASHSAFSNDFDVDMGNGMAAHPSPRNYNNANRNNSCGRQRRKNKGRSRQRPVVHLEPIFEDPMEMSIDAFDPLSPQDVSSDVAVLPASGVISPKLLQFIRNMVEQQHREQDFVSSRAGVKGGRKKQRRFCVQDLCLIQRVETELRNVFGVVESPVRVWTPSTSLLRSSISSNQTYRGRPWVRGLLLALNGFQRMLVHATANYLGLRSFSE